MSEQADDSKQHDGIGRNQPLRLLAGVLMIVLWGADLDVHHSHVQKVLGLVLIAALTQITVTDLESRRIQNHVTFPAAVLALLIGLIMHPSGLGGQVVAGVATGAVLFLVAIFSRGGIGMGDVKLGALLGLFLGRYVVLALVVGLLASALLSIGVLSAKGVAAGRKTTIPLGPFLALGGVVALLLGPSLHWAT